MTIERNKNVKAYLGHSHISRIETKARKNIVMLKVMLFIISFIISV